jgi:hypothetical protein
MNTTKTTSIYDRKIKKFHVHTEVINHRNLHTFDEFIEQLKALKQKYLEHEFLYKRTVTFDLHGGLLLDITVSGPESENEYKKRIEKYEKSKITREAAAEKRRAESLKKEIEKFKQLKKSLGSKVDLNTI